jgi:SAM-dependent methyltransferase
MKFPHSALATKYLKGLKGVEIGGSAHNDYFLDVVNVDYTDEHTIYKQHEIDLCGECRKVDVVADATNLPFGKGWWDFVLTSHVLEHLWDPIGALMEWKRVSKKYIFITVPRKDLTFDKDKPVTDFYELVDRHNKIILQPADSPKDDHWTIWDVEQFRFFCNEMADELDLNIVEFQDLDDKVGNGMTVLFELRNA